MHTCERFGVQKTQNISAQSLALDITIGHFAHLLQRYHVVHELVGHLVYVGFGADGAKDGAGRGFAVCEVNVLDEAVRVQLVTTADLVVESVREEIFKETH